MNTLLKIIGGAVGCLTLLALPRFEVLAKETTPPRESLSRFAHAPLEIATQTGKPQRFEVWIADTPARRSQGLMFVKHLARDRGMLFLFNEPQQISMWMKNTYIPLDMLFISAERRIIRI